MTTKPQKACLFLFLVTEVLRKEKTEAMSTGEEKCLERLFYLPWDSVLLTSDFDTRLPT